MREVVMRAEVFAGALLRARGTLQELWRNSQGAAAVEFAYLAPLLLLMLLGTIEIGRAMNIDRHFSMATATTADLVAREEYLGTSTSDATTNLNSMMLSIKQIMQPYDASTMKLGIFQVRASVDQCKRHQGRLGRTPTMASPSPPSVSTTPFPPGSSGRAEASSWLNRATSSNRCLPISFLAFPARYTWTDKQLNSPRNSCVDYVKPSGTACISTC